MSIVTDTLKAELLELIPISKKYADDIDTAKTEFKKTFAKKKLAKNNAKIADILIALNRVEQNKNEKIDEERGTPEASSTVELAEQDHAPSGRDG